MGKLSKCYCGHAFPQHNDSFFGKKQNTTCQKCPCKRFAYVPARPEECGMYWLVRRKDFDVNTWRAPCKYFFYELDVNIIAKNIVFLIHYDAKNVHVLILLPISHVLLVMELGKIIKCCMNARKIDKCWVRKLEMIIFLFRLTNTSKSRCSIRKSIK